MQYLAKPFPELGSRRHLGQPSWSAERFPTCDPFILAPAILKTHIATLVGKMSLELLYLQICLLCIRSPFPAENLTKQC